MNKKTVALLSLALFSSFFLDKIISDNVKYIQAPALTDIMTWFSHEITVFVVLVAISSLFLYEEGKSKFITVLFLCFITAFFASFILKLIIMRARPLGLSYINISVMGIALKIGDYSFPSIHSAIAFSVLPVLDKEFKKLKWFWIFFSCMIVISRIYLNQHFLSDVIAGCLLGYMIGHYVTRLGEKHGIERILHEL